MERRRDQGAHGPVRVGLLPRAFFQTLKFRGRLETLQWRVFDVSGYGGLLTENRSANTTRISPPDSAWTLNRA